MIQYAVIIQLMAYHTADILFTLCNCITIPEGVETIIYDRRCKRSTLNAQRSTLNLYLACLLNESCVALFYIITLPIAIVYIVVVIKSIIDLCRKQPFFTIVYLLYYASSISWQIIIILQIDNANYLVSNRQQIFPFASCTGKNSYPSHNTRYHFPIIMKCIKIYFNRGYDSILASLTTYSVF